MSRPLQTARHTFTAPDAEVLQYKSWLPEGEIKHALILLHRGHEHADRWDSVVPGLALPGLAIFAWEARGHGQSPGKRGHAPGFMTYVRDLEAFVTHLTRTHSLQREQLAVLAHSVGAVVAAAWVHDYAPPLAGLILATPAFEVKLYVPGALAGCRILQKRNPQSTIKSYVRGHWLTRDVEEQRRYDADTSISKDISARILVDLFDTAHRVVTDAAVMTTPLLLISAGDDRVVKQAPQERFFNAYAGSPKTHHTLAGARHAIFHDLCRDEVTTLVRAFLEARFAAPVVNTNTMTQPCAAVTEEYASLQRPLPALSPKRLNYALQRLSMKTLGKLSEGIQLGWELGFDSGQSLDYVYDDKPDGFGPLGKWIDRTYLDAIGWRGIRQRRQMLLAALREALANSTQAGAPRVLADIAGGGGRYLLDMLAEDQTGLHVICRDWSSGALSMGRKAAEERGLISRIQFEHADAFDEQAVSGITPRPGVAVVSGLYELFPENEPIRRSLRGLHTALSTGGWLVYTGQPWHPQVEMIARVLTNRDDKPWIMRRRPQGEMDALVREAGFEKQAQWTDDFGIFTVSAARKI